MLVCSCAKSKGKINQILKTASSMCKKILPWNCKEELFWRMSIHQVGHECLSDHNDRSDFFSLKTKIYAQLNGVKGWVPSNRFWWAAWITLCLSRSSIVIWRLNELRFYLYSSDKDWITGCGCVFDEPHSSQVLDCVRVWFVEQIIAASFMRIIERFILILFLSVLFHHQNNRTSTCSSCL